VSLITVSGTFSFRVGIHMFKTERLVTLSVCDSQSIMLFRVVQVTISLQDPLEVGNSLLGISDNVRE